MTPLWRKQLSKVSDVLFNIVIGPSFWTEDMFEPLTFALICPMTDRPPYKLERWDKLEIWCSEMSGMWNEDTETIGTHLRKLWSQAQ